MNILSIFCGCTSNKNIQDSVITLNVDDIIKIEVDIKQEDNIKQEDDIKQEDTNIPTKSKLDELLEILEIKNDEDPDLDKTFITRNTDKEEDKEIIDTLSIKPNQDNEEIISKKRKYFIF